MDWKNKKVLVTGAGGFIGSHLTENLVTLGADVKAFVRYNSRNDWGMLEHLPLHIRDKIEVVAGDLKEPALIRETAKNTDIVFHLAALIGVPYSYLSSRDVIETNVIGTLNVLNAAREQGVERVIHTSTSEVYGTAQDMPMDEKHPLQAQSPYSASKIGADKLAESYYLSYDLPVTIVRPFNTYGPRQSARAIIPTIITQALTRDKIFLGAMHPTRDFTFVEDAVDGFIKAAESSESVGEVINLGSGTEISIGNLADKIISLVGKKVEVVFDATRLRPKRSEVERLVANTTKARELIGWEPQVPLDEGLEKTIGWISEWISIFKVDVYNV